jgi:DUF4097 and DUF4098 domain-containing protein YvlB
VAVAEDKQSEFDRVVVKPPQAVAVEQVVVENSLGNVRIEGHDRNDLIIEAQKRAADDETLKRLSVAVTPRAGGIMHIGTALEAAEEARPIAAGSIAINLIIKVPRAARPDVSIWKGQVWIAGVDNGAAVNANQADVDMRRVSGAIESHVAQGRQQFAELLGADVVASSLRGDVALEWVTGDLLDAWTHTGDLIAERLRVRRISLRTVRGNVFVKAQMMAGGRYEFLSYHGDVEVGVDRGVPVKLDARSHAGRVSLPEEFRTRMQGDEPLLFAEERRGAGRADLRIRSRHGDVRLVEVNF